MNPESEFGKTGTRGTDRSVDADHMPVHAGAAQGPKNDTENTGNVDGAQAAVTLDPILFPSTKEASHGNRINDLASEIASLYPMLAALAGSKIKLEIACEACPRGELYLTSFALMQLLINLVRNSAEAIVAKGHIVISAKPFRSSAYKEACVLLTVEGDGPGIPPALLDKVFSTDAMHNSQHDYDQPRMRFKPRGLGLRIVRELVESAGGSIRAVRLPDRGSRFEVAIPMVTDIAKYSIA